MAFIETIGPSEADEETAEVYRYLHQMVQVPIAFNIVRMFSLEPGSMRRMVRHWELSMWVGEEPRDQRELLASLVSRLNDCAY